MAAPRRGNTGRQASDSADDIVSDITREEDDRSPVYSDYGSSRMTREDSNENTGVRFTESFPRTPQQQRGPTSSAARLRRRRSAIDIEILAEKARLPALPAVNPGKEPRRFTETELDKMQRYESLDTFIPQTTMHKDHLEYRSREPRWFIWVFVLVVGVLTAAVAVLMVSCIHMLFAIRMRLLQYGLLDFAGDKIPPIYDNDAFTQSQSSVFSGQDVHLFGLPMRNHWGGFAMHFLFSLVMSCGAAAICALVPSAIGPGGPEVMAFLNGVENPVLADTKALVAKFFATILAMASGVPLGFYGSLVQLGTMVATGLLTRSRYVRFDSLRIVSCFRNPRDSRIITVIGAACGFASAFSVSIGGLMIVMEQMSSIFPVRFALYVFVGSLISSLAIQVYFSYFSYFGDRDRTGLSTAQLLSEVLIQFDTRIHDINPVPMNILVFIPAIVLGVVCGYLSALFVRIHGLALNLRRRAEARYNTKAIRYLASVAVTMMYVVATFWISVAFGGNTTNSGYACQVIPDNGTIMISRKLSVVSYYGMNGMLCEPHILNLTAGAGSPYYVVPPDVLPTINLSSSTTHINGTYGGFYAPPLMQTYSSMAFGMADSTLQFLISWRTPDVVPPGILLLFGVVYFFFSALSSGVSIEGDVILPSLVIGGCVGRLCGIGVHELWQVLGMGGETWTDPGVFAFLGAGCFFGGLSGITFSTCVILTEMTNDFRHTLPLMLGISIAKRVAEKFTHNINTTFLEERSVPILDFDARVHKYDMFSAKNVMTNSAVTMHAVTTIEEVMNVLRGCTHHAFPIVSVRDGTYKGIVQRDAVVMYLWHLFLTDNHSEMTLEQVQRVEDRLFYDNLAERAYAEAAQSLTNVVSSEGLPAGGGGGQPYRPRASEGNFSRNSGRRAESPNRRSSNLGNRSPSMRQRRHSIIQRPTYHSISDVLADEFDADECYPPLPPFEDFWMSDRVDLSAHMDQSGFCVLDTTSLSRTYHLFRTLGMRHLVVVSKENLVVGMITRKDLITHNILNRITEVNTDRRRQLQVQRAQARQQGLAEAKSDSDNTSSDDDDGKPVAVEAYDGRITTPTIAQPMFSFGSAQVGASAGRGGGGATTSTQKKKKKSQQPNWIVVDEQDADDAALDGLGVAGLGSMHPVMLPATAHSRTGSLAVLPEGGKASGSGQKLNGSITQVPQTATLSQRGRSETAPVGRRNVTPPNRKPDAGPLVGSTQQRVKAMLQEVPSDVSDEDAHDDPIKKGNTSPQQQVSANGSQAGSSFGQTPQPSTQHQQFVPSKKFSGVLKLVPSLTSMNESITSPVPQQGGGGGRSTTTSFRGSDHRSSLPPQAPKSSDEKVEKVAVVRQQYLLAPHDDEDNFAASVESPHHHHQRLLRRQTSSSESASASTPVSPREEEEDHSASLRQTSSATAAPSDGGAAGREDSYQGGELVDDNANSGAPRSNASSVVIDPSLVSNVVTGEENGGGGSGGGTVVSINRQSPALPTSSQQPQQASQGGKRRAAAEALLLASKRANAS